MSKRYTTTVAAVAAVAAAISLAGTTAAGAATPSAGRGPVKGDTSSGPERQVKERTANYDGRSFATGSGVSTLARALRAKDSADATARLRALVGPDAMISIDPSTQTPANLASWEGYLTGPSSASAEAVALGYVRRNAAALGLAPEDLSTFTLRKDYVDVAGAHHLSFTQSARGVTVFGNGLKAHVTKDGRLLALQGAPVAGLTALAGAAAVSPKVAAAAARAGAAKDAGGAAASATPTTKGSGVRWSNGDQASLVWFVAGGAARLGWSTYTQAGGDRNFAHVVDAATGSVLYRRDLAAKDKGDALVYDYHPGAARGGSPKVVNFIDKGWLGPRQTWLRGTNTFAWADVKDDNRPGEFETTPVPGAEDGDPQFNLKPFDTNPLCSARFVCTWAPNTPFSWRANKFADVTNAFYLSSNFHDWLKGGVIGFTPAAGNFELAGGDPVLLNAMDGASSAGGLPDGNHIDNANMSTPPDGIPPTMQMYLFHFPRATNQQDPFAPVSSSFDATILYHEYVHGLSNRLVVDAQGNSTLNSVQAGSMGEAWSDWYALDYLVRKGFVPDSRTTDGQVVIGAYVEGGGAPLIRTQALDCDPDSTAAKCTDVYGKKGGYTYGDLSTVIPTGAEVHASGEIWGQTLWDIRETLGSTLAESLVTRGMELSVNDPSFLDMRNAILLADRAHYQGRHVAALWRIFAQRGMGWFAGSVDAGDAFPVEDFNVPPAPSLPRGTLQGVVTDPDNGARVAGATVTITGHPEYTATTGAHGYYRISDVRGGTYGKVIAMAPGFTTDVKRASVPRGGPNQVNFSIRRDWAASSGGGEIVAFNGPDYSPFGCGPAGAIDLSQGTGWGSTTGDDAGTPTNKAVPKFIKVALPDAVDIRAGRTDGRTAFRVDPSNTCGDPGSASTNEYRIEVSRNGSTWTEVVDAAFGTIEDPDSRGRYFDVASTRSVDGVRFVRFWMDSPQVPDFAKNCPGGAFAGCVFMDLTELQVFGQASR